MIGDQDFARLDDAWSAALDPLLSVAGPTVVLFSGGVDSGLLAWELRRKPDLTLFTVGVRGSPDLATAEEAARVLGLPWLGAEVSMEDVLAVNARASTELLGLGPTARSVQTAVAVAVARAPAGTLLCGQGVDELFLGYAHFRSLDVDAAGRRADSDLQLLLDHEWPRSVRIARQFERALVAPFLDPGFVAAAQALPIELRRPEPVPKSWFRQWAIHRGLAAAVANRPKRALQFGSGIDRLLRRAARTSPRS
jgi:asparagine synthase (glutamine-hydrolysing)